MILPGFINKSTEDILIFLPGIINMSTEDILASRRDYQRLQYRLMRYSSSYDRPTVYMKILYPCLEVTFTKYLGLIEIVSLLIFCWYSSNSNTIKESQVINLDKKLFQEYCRLQKYLTCQLIRIEETWQITVLQSPVSNFFPEIGNTIVFFLLVIFSSLKFLLCCQMLQKVLVFVNPASLYIYF